MSFQIRPIDDDKWELIFFDEPSYIHALKMAPESMEPELNSGVWLIVSFPVWSAPVRHSVLAAVAFAKDYGGELQLGVRPYESHEEAHKWWPSSIMPFSDSTMLTGQAEPQSEVHLSTDYSINPVWLVLRDGQVIHQSAGPRTKEELSELIGGFVI